MPNYSHGLTSLLCASVLSRFSHVRLFAMLWTVACQAPPSMGFSRQDPCLEKQGLWTIAALVSASMMWHRHNVLHTEPTKSPKAEAEQNTPAYSFPYLFTASDFTSITSHINNWHCFCLGSVSSLFLELFLHTSSILGSYQRGEFIFQCKTLQNFPTHSG